MILVTACRKRLVPCPCGRHYCWVYKFQQSTLFIACRVNSCSFADIESCCVPQRIVIWNVTHISWPISPLSLGHDATKFTCPRSEVKAVFMSFDNLHRIYPDSWPKIFHIRLSEKNVCSSMSWEGLTQQKSHVSFTHRSDFHVRPHPKVSEVQVPTTDILCERSVSVDMCFWAKTTTRVTPHTANSSKLNIKSKKQKCELKKNKSVFVQSFASVDCTLSQSESIILHREKLPTYIPVQRKFRRLVRDSHKTTSCLRNQPHSSLPDRSICSKRVTFRQKSLQFTIQSQGWYLTQPLRALTKGDNESFCIRRPRICICKRQKTQNKHKSTLLLYMKNESKHGNMRNQHIRISSSLVVKSDSGQCKHFCWKKKKLLQLTLLCVDSIQSENERAFHVELCGLHSFRLAVKNYKQKLKRNQTVFVWSLSKCSDFWSKQTKPHNTSDVGLLPNSTVQYQLHAQVRSSHISLWCVLRDLVCSDRNKLWSSQTSNTC